MCVTNQWFERMKVRIEDLQIAWINREMLYRFTQRTLHLSRGEGFRCLYFGLIVRTGEQYVVSLQLWSNSLKVTHERSDFKRWSCFWMRRSFSAQLARFVSFSLDNVSRWLMTMWLMTVVTTMITICLRNIIQGS